MRSRSFVIALLLFFAISYVGLWPSPVAAQVTASPPYTVSVFATSVPGVYTKPDSITADSQHVYIGYGNGVATDGSDGKSSTIVEYDLHGTVLNTFSVKGHNDGLKLNPNTSLLWALQNEDGNPNLVIINPANGSQKTYTFPPTLHGGGYDDIAFVGNDVYISASNPQQNPNTAPAIVSAKLVGKTVVVTPILAGNSTATDVTTGTVVILNLQDPDSLILDPSGDLVLDSQSDMELIIVHHAGLPDQKAFRVNLISGGIPTQVDDTIFTTSTQGSILVSDRDGETVYSIQAPFFAPSASYSAGPTFVGRVGLDTGVLTPVVSSMVSPHGMVFVAQ